MHQYEFLCVFFFYQMVLETYENTFSDNFLKITQYDYNGGDFK